MGSARARARLLGCEKHELEGGSESTLLDEFLKQLPFSLSLSLFLSLSLPSVTPSQGGCVLPKTQNKGDCLVMSFILLMA